MAEKLLAGRHSMRVIVQVGGNFCHSLNDLGDRHIVPAQRVRLQADPVGMVYIARESDSDAQNLITGNFARANQRWNPLLDGGRHGSGLRRLFHLLLRQGIAVKVSQHHHGWIFSQAHADEVPAVSIQCELNSRAALLLLVVGTGGLMNQTLLNQAPAQLRERRSAEPDRVSQVGPRHRSVFQQRFNDRRPRCRNPRAGGSPAILFRR